MAVTPSPTPILPPPPTPAASVSTIALTCWKCRYDLTGLRVEDACPECGTPVWSGPGAAGEQMYPEAFAWGLASLILGAALIGPLAAFIAIPAIVKGRRAMEAVRTGRKERALATSAKTGMILGWVTIGLSGVTLVLIGVGVLIYWLR